MMPLAYNHFIWDMNNKLLYNQNGTYVNASLREKWMKMDKHIPSKGFAHRFNVDSTSKYIS